MARRFKPKVTRNREATQEEIDCIKKTEEMLEEEQKLPPASPMKLILIQIKKMVGVLIVVVL